MYPSINKTCISHIPQLEHHILWDYVTTGQKGDRHREHSTLHKLAGIEEVLFEEHLNNLDSMDSQFLITFIKKWNEVLD